MPAPFVFQVSFKVVSVKLRRDGRLTTNGTVCFAMVGGPTRLRRQMHTLQQRGYKVGLRLRRGQQIERREYRGDFGDLVRQDRAVTAELIRTFGTAPGEKWVGFVATPPLRLKPRMGKGNVICFDTTFTLTNFKSEPQLVPVVYTYSDERFRRHYMLGVRVLTKGRPLAEADVRAVY